jgi:hypothetical protein
VNKNKGIIMELIDLVETQDAHGQYAYICVLCDFPVVCSDDTRPSDEFLMRSNKAHYDEFHSQRSIFEWS